MENAVDQIAFSLSPFRSPVSVFFSFRAVSFFRALFSFRAISPLPTVSFRCCFLRCVCYVFLSLSVSLALCVSRCQMVIDAVPSVEMVRFTNSGTEACMGMLRLVRAYTNREKIIKFEGCYHGLDMFCVKIDVLLCVCACELVHM